ncbi:hypothetical protein IU449_27710 [Nocardia higoensis]|uniref:Uncharacterized protein n=1 Tax=Nocardia higoensis TaxID=228599 RepID=A0ABS0DMK3_9NOCA|nr:hypothetical protein [Nocardia higoensis]MBF6358289.1 hypothetical protein [Nocardia higoensis]
MPATTKTLLLIGATLLAIIAGTAAAVLSKYDGATTPAAVRAGGISFGGTLTLILLTITTYTLL